MLLPLEKLEHVKNFVVTELKNRGIEIPPEWTPGAMMYDTMEFVHEGQKYHMCLSCRRNNSFGFILAGIQKDRYAPMIANETIAYDGYQNEINVYLEKLSHFEEHPDPELKNCVVVPKTTQIVYGLGDVYKKVNGLWVIIQKPESMSDTYFLDEYLREFCQKRGDQYVYGTTWIPPPKEDHRVSIK